MIATGLKQTKEPSQRLSQNPSQSMDAPDARRRTRATALGLALMAIALYAPLIGWGAPQATAPNRIKTFATDEILPLETLAEMRNTFIVSKPDRNYGYPWWHYFVVAVAQSPYLGYLRLSGGMQAPSPEYPFGLQDPVRALRILTLIGRMVSVLMAAGVVVAAYYFADILWGRQAGVITAALTMLNYLMFYYSRTGNLDVPVFFWSGVGLAIFAKIMVGGLTARRAAHLGVFAGLAMATKDQAVVIFLPLGCCLLLPRLIPLSGTSARWRPILVGLAASLVAYGVGTGLVVDPQRHLTHVYALFFDPQRLTGAASYWPRRPQTWAGTMSLLGDYLRKLAAMASPPLLLTSVAGALLALRFKPRLLILLLPVAALFVMLLWPTGGVVLRYLLPLALIINAFAAYALIEMRRSRLRPLWVPLLVILCGWQLLIGVDLTYAQYYDTRYEATAWFERERPRGARVEYFGAAETMPHLPADIISRPVAGRSQWVGKFGHGPDVLRYLAREGPEYVVIIPDWTSQPGMERSADCPPEVYAALKDGAIGYGQAAFFAPRSLLSGWRSRPPLDNPSVCPPVRIFARRDVLNRTKTQP
ncbi:MAG: ArnT family glycosyltransferase [Blastocatellia bacterium]